MNKVFSSLDLPNGSTIHNRLCKAAMEENMADAGQIPSQALIQLYDVWSKGQPGIILTGNVMVDPTALTGPGGVVLDKTTFDQEGNKALFEKWARTGKAHGSQMWMQISHPGRQVYANQGTEVVSASATKVQMAGAEKMFATARALSLDDIKALVNRFADTAAAAEASGFDGVEVHAAHGYLVSQFLSPLTNLRDDKYGGSLENRSRFLREIITAIRGRVKSSFGVAVKLNSADFQRGGFDIEDAAQVVGYLNSEKVDFVELSGGSYESAAMMGMADDGRAQSTKDREMYFIDFAQDIAKAAKMPIMVTGGVTKYETAEAALAAGNVDIIGLARAFAYAPVLPSDWQAGERLQVHISAASFKNPLLKALGTMALTKTQLHLMGDGKAPNPKANAIIAIIKDRLRLRKKNKRYQAWLANL